MITKEFFVKSAQRIEDRIIAMDKLSAAVKEYSPEFGEFYDDKSLTIMTDILTEAMDDKDEWIPYFFWECPEFQSGGCVITVDGEEYEITTWEEVYDLIVGNI